MSLIHVFRELELRLGDVEPAFPFLPDRLWCLIMIISCGRCEVGKLSRALYLTKDNILYCLSFVMYTQRRSSPLKSLTM